IARPSLTPAKGLAASAPRPRACSPPADRTAAKTAYRARRAPDRILPIRSTGTTHPWPTSSPSEEILERELLVGPARRFRRQGLAEVVAGQRFLLRPLPGEEGFLVPAVDFSHVGEGLRNATCIVLPIRHLLELCAGEIRLGLHSGILLVRHDPRDLHPGHEFLAHLLEPSRRAHVAHGTPGPVLG